MHKNSIQLTQLHWHTAFSTSFFLLFNWNTLDVMMKSGLDIRHQNWISDLFVSHSSHTVLETCFNEWPIAIWIVPTGPHCIWCWNEKNNINALHTAQCTVSVDRVVIRYMTIFLRLALDTKQKIIRNSDCSLCSHGDISTINKHIYNVQRAFTFVFTHFFILRFSYIFCSKKCIFLIIILSFWIFELSH